jgi:hypothetical protein
MRNPTGSGIIARLRFRKIIGGCIQRFQKEKRDTLLSNCAAAPEILRRSLSSANGRISMSPERIVFTHLDWDAATGVECDKPCEARKTVRFLVFLELGAAPRSDKIEAADHDRYARGHSSLIKRFDDRGRRKRQGQ